MIKTQHKRTAVASMFQNDIPQNTKCAERDSFHREGHIYSLTLMLHSNRPEHIMLGYKFGKNNVGIIGCL